MKQTLENNKETENQLIIELTNSYNDLISIVQLDQKDNFLA